MSGSKANARLCLVFFLVLIHSSLSIKLIPSFAGPYNIIFKRLHNLTDESAGSRQLWIHGYISSYRQGHMQYYRGVVVNCVPLGNNYRANVVIDSRSNNQWKKNAFVMNFPRFCSDLTKHGIAAKQLLFGGDAKKCPIPTGYRDLKNESINVEFPNFPTFPYGHWLVTLLVIDRKGKSLGGIAIEIETVPKV